MSDRHKFTGVVPKKFKPPELPPIARNPLIVNAEDNFASEFHKRLVKWINDFDATLDEQHEVGVRLVSFGQSISFHLENLGYSNPSLISFSGTMDSGAPVELIQHVSQISILLMKLPRREPDTPKKPIGFRACDGDSENSGKNEQSDD